MSTHNKCFYGELEEIIPESSPNVLIIWSYVLVINKLFVTHLHDNHRKSILHM